MYPWPVNGQLLVKCEREWFKNKGINFRMFYLCRQSNNNSLVDRRAAGEGSTYTLNI